MGRTIAVTILMLSSLCEQIASTGATRLAPARLAIYYGYPSLINGASGNVDRAVAVFADYDVIVLGDGLQFADVNPRRLPPGPGVEEHRRTRAIIERLRTRSSAVRVYGYIDLGNSQKLSIEEIQNRARQWASIGSTGIFLDEAGYDFGVTRERQNAVVDFVHSLGLSVFVNAFNPDDVFSAAATPLNAVGGGNPGAAPTRLGPNDAFLLESFQVRLGELDNWPTWSARAKAAVNHRERFKSKVFAVTTTTAASERAAAALYSYAWWSAAIWGLDGFGWGEPDFGGLTSRMQARHTVVKPETIAGTRFLSAPIETPQGLERRTDAGMIVLSRTERVGQFIRHGR
jgi:hypothetical protein